MNLVKNIISTATGLLFLGILGMVAYSFLSSASFGYKMIDTLKPMPTYNTPAESDYATGQTTPDSSDFPIVRLHDEKGNFFCSGTVISDSYVLTAAHCLVDGNSLSKRVIHVKNAKLEEVSAAVAAGFNRRADYGLVKGDFSKMKKIHILPKSDMPYRFHAPMYTCGYPWGSDFQCYPVAPTGIFWNFLAGKGLMYPGMSGGPLISSDDLIGAVNSGVTEEGLVFAPIIGLFETLNVEVK